MLLHTVKVWAIIVVLGLHLKKKKKKRSFPKSEVVALNTLSSQYIAPQLCPWKHTWFIHKISICDRSPTLHRCIRDCTYLEVNHLWILKQASSGLKNRDSGLGLKFDTVSLHLCFFSAEFYLPMRGGRSQHCKVCGSRSRSLTASTVTCSRF